MSTLSVLSTFTFFDIKSMCSCLVQVRFFEEGVRKEIAQVARREELREGLCPLTDLEEKMKDEEVEAKGVHVAGGLAKKAFEEVRSRLKF